MPSEKTEEILEVFGLHHRHYVFLIGGGGKTSLMYALAHAMVGRGRSVLTTTSTKILYPEPHQCERVLIESDVDRALQSAQHEIVAGRHVTLASARTARANKLIGFSAQQLDRLRDGRVADDVLVEADGAAGRSLKAHREHEPVVSTRADLVVAVVGVDCLARPMSAENVHRCELFCARVNRAPGTAIAVDDIAAVFFHDQGYLRRISTGVRIAVFINKADTAPARNAATALAAVFAQRDVNHRLSKIVIGDVHTGYFAAWSGC